MANVSINNITETWSSSGTTYTGIKYNVTDTASAAGSKLIDLQVGGVSKFSVDKTGNALITKLTLPTGGTNNTSFVGTGNGAGWIGTEGGVQVFGVGYLVGAILNREHSFGWTSSNTNAITGVDLALSRDGTGVLAQRVTGSNPQSYRIYLSYTDATNNSRFAINATSNYYRLASEIGTSTGSKKPIVTDIYQSTVDPTTTDIPDGTSTVWKNTTSGVVKLWANNGGTLIGVALA